jgi:hypothetical protein
MPHQKWDTANAIKAQAAAEKLLPETKENASYKQDMLDLKTALDARKSARSSTTRPASSSSNSIRLILRKSVHNRQ